MKNPGKYDDLCSVILKGTRARAVVVCVIDGALGSGFSVEGEFEAMLSIPDVLKRVASAMQKDIDERLAKDYS